MAEVFSANGERRRQHGMRRKQVINRQNSESLENALMKTGDNVAQYSNVDGFDNADGKKLKPAVKGALFGFGAIALATLLILAGKLIAKKGVKA